MERWSGGVMDGWPKSAMFLKLILQVVLIWSLKCVTFSPRFFFLVSSFYTRAKVDGKALLHFESHHSLEMPKNPCILLMVQKSGRQVEKIIYYPV